MLHREDHNTHLNIWGSGSYNVEGMFEHQLALTCFKEVILGLRFWLGNNQTIINMKVVLLLSDILLSGIRPKQDEREALPAHN